MAKLTKIEEELADSISYYLKHPEELPLKKKKDADDEFHITDEKIEKIIKEALNKNNDEDGEKTKICKSCGIEITEDEYEAFSGNCVGCSEINIDIIEELDREEGGENIEQKDKNGKPRWKPDNIVNFSNGQTSLIEEEEL